MRSIRRRLEQLERNLPEPLPSQLNGCEVCRSARYSLLVCPDGPGTPPTRLLGGEPLPEKCPGCGGNILDADPPLRILFAIVKTPEQAAAVTTAGRCGNSPLTGQ